MTTTQQTPTAKKRSAVKTFQLIWQHLGRWRNLYVSAIALIIIDAVCHLIVPLLFRDILNRIDTDALGFIERDFVWSLLKAVGLTCVFFPAAYYGHMLMTLTAIRLANDLRVSLYTHVQRLSADFFQRYKVGEIATRLSADIGSINQCLGILFGGSWALIIVLFSTAMMIYINPFLFAVMGVFMFCVMLLSRLFLPWIREMNRSVRNAAGVVNASVTEYIGINALIKSYAGEHYIRDYVARDSDDVRRKEEYMQWRQTLYGDIMQVLVKFLAPLALLLTGARLIASDQLAIGDLVAFWGFWHYLGSAIQSLVGGMSALFQGLASADRVFDFFDETPLIKDMPGAPELEKVNGDIAFNGVSFVYPLESDVRVLNDFNLSIPAGRIVGLVGPSGAGKSTILSLALRFYDPIAGTVTLDGRDIRTFSQQSLRANIGFVMQDSVFFAGDIRKNMRIARIDATDDEMIAALKNANAWEFVEKLPEGLNSEIGERGVKLSGGQRQRLSIARVFLKDPSILLFDEATSALDSISEKMVQDAMFSLMKGRTTIVVAHRISTLQNADIIHVIDDGRIAHSGTHNELLEKSSLYEELCAHQGLGRY